MINPQRSSLIQISNLVKVYQNKYLNPTNSFQIALDLSIELFQQEKMMDQLQEQKGALKCIQTFKNQMMKNYQACGTCHKYNTCNVCTYENKQTYLQSTQNQHIFHLQKLTLQALNIDVVLLSTPMSSCQVQQQMIRSSALKTRLSLDQLSNIDDFQISNPNNMEQEQSGSISLDQHIIEFNQHKNSQSTQQTDTPSPPFTPENNKQVKVQRDFSLSNILQSLTLRQNIQPKKGVYYKKRKQFFQWMKRQCSILRLLKQTFANCICLMDFYYKNTPLHAESFIRKSLSMLIISSKSIESKVLYTPTVAENNEIDKDLMLETQIQMLNWFKFQVNSYNYIREINKFVQIWNHKIQNRHLQHKYCNFFEDSQQSFLFYQKFIFICQQFLKEKGHLVSSVIIKILQFVVLQKYRDKQVLEILEEICHATETLNDKQVKYIYEYSYDELKQSDINADLQRYNILFGQSEEEYRAYYFRERIKYSKYAQFLNVLYFSEA